MRQSVGGVLNFTILFVMILLVSGFIALAFNYTKAYRVKENILTLIEKYEGNLENSNLISESKAYANSIGYKVRDDFIDSIDESVLCYIIQS